MICCAIVCENADNKRLLTCKMWKNMIKSVIEDDANTKYILRLGEYDLKRCHVWRKVFLIFMVLAVLFVSTGCMMREETVTATGISWEYSLEIQKEVLCEESGWSLPSEAELIKKKREIYKTKYDEDGNFDGYEYRTKYYYEILRWKYDRTVTTTGEDYNPYFGEYTLAENEKVASESKHHYIHGINQENEEVKYTVEYEEWIKVGPGDVLSLEVSIFGNATILSNQKAIEMPE